MLVVMAVMLGRNGGYETEEPPRAQEPRTPVGGQAVDGLSRIERTLSAVQSGIAQGFTTGARSGGYTIDWLGVQVSHFYGPAIVGEHLQVTLNERASDGGPGNALCTLTNPSSFQAPGVIGFEAPTGAAACPQLAAETKYFVVIEWLKPTGPGPFARFPQAVLADESVANGESPGGAEGWSIAHRSYHLIASKEVRRWRAYQGAASFKIQLKLTAP